MLTVTGADVGTICLSSAGTQLRCEGASCSDGRWLSQAAARFALPGLKPLARKSIPALPCSTSTQTQGPTMPQPAIRTVRLRAQRLALRMLLGGRCVRCGGQGALQFDVVVPCDSSHHWTGSTQRQAFYEAQHRAGNLQLLCFHCHLKKSAEDRRAGRVPSPTGDGLDWTLPPRPDAVAGQPEAPAPPRNCPQCGKPPGACGCFFSTPPYLT